MDKPERVKLIFNPSAGRAIANPMLLTEILSALQALNYIPEVYLLEPGCDLKAALDDALRRKTRLFVICGGDGTIETVAGLLVGKRATLGVIPAGTQNNVALSLGIPANVREAVALLRNGSRIPADVGMVSNGKTEVPFLEVCSVGLFSALFEAADNIQKGDITRLGDLLDTLVSFPPAEIRLTLDDRQKIDLQGHVVLVANLPYFGLNYRASQDGSITDGVLDVLIFSEFTKLELVGNIVQGSADDTNDPRIRRLRAKKLTIATQPAMPVHADGFALGKGEIQIHVKSKALTLISGSPVKSQPRWGFLRNFNLLRFFQK